MTTVNPTHFPLDVREIVKGEEYDMSSVMTNRVGTPAARLELLTLRDHLQQSADEIGLVLSLRTKGESVIRCMTDAEASRYHNASAGHAVAKLGRQVRKMAKNVDRSRLTVAEVENHDRNISHRALQYLSARKPTKHISKDAGGAFIRKIQQAERPNPFKK
jgi:hypothetical protein